MIIDLLGDKTFTEHELRYIAQDEIASRWNASQRANVQSKIQGVALQVYTPNKEDLEDIERYKNDLIEIKEITEKAILDNQLLIETIEYETALIRLSQYQLSEGRAEQKYVEIINGVEEILIIPEISPIPLTVSEIVYDEFGNSNIIEVPNPKVIQDTLERSYAETIINNVSKKPEILNLVKLRAERQSTSTSPLPNSPS